MNAGNAARAQRGFTLLEIIVVVLVFSVMAAMAYGGLNSVLKTRRGIEDSMDRTADLQRAYLRLRNDFQNLRDRPVRDGYGDPQAPLLAGRDGALDVVRGGWRSPRYSGRSSLERVRYELRDGAVRRMNWKVLDLPPESKPVDLPLLQGVRDLRWRFLDADGQWQTQWPADAQRAGDIGSAAVDPPMAVEVTLDLRDMGELRWLFRTPQSQLAGSSTGGDGSLITREGLLGSAALGLKTADRTAEPQDDSKDDAKDPAQDDNNSSSGTDGQGDTGSGDNGNDPGEAADPNQTDSQSGGGGDA